MSKLRDHIKSIDDLTSTDYEIPEWPHPDKPGECVHLTIKAPTLHRRNQLMRAFAANRDDGGEVLGDMDWDGLALAVIGEMVYDPDDADAGPLFAAPEDRQILLEKNGRVCWDLMNKCLEYGGFRDADEESPVDAGKES